MRRYQSEFIISFVLILTTLVVFWEVTNHGFLNYDDNQYVTQNHHVQAGLTLKSIKWAFTSAEFYNWHPLTWLSHMLDSQLYGLNPMGHHLSSLLFHIANTVLLFLILKRMTGILWPSAFVAALFALHPLHVESVAWIAERKDVLSGFFWMLTMWAYICYVKRPGAYRYFLTLIIFAFGLMAKPMLVTLPFTLLLLDYWPLDRFRFGHTNDLESNGLSSTGFQKSALSRLILEKIPFIGLAIISSIVTVIAQQKGGAVMPFDAISLKYRIANALVSYITYIGKMIWPGHLAVFYPHPGITLPIWQVVAAILFLLSISFITVLAVRRFPYLAVGWLWYLGTLMPVIGIVQVGGQALADRYTYIPLIGLFIIFAWGTADFVKKWRYKNIFLFTSAGAILLYFIVFTRLQVSHWSDSISLFEHTIKITNNNYIAYNNIGIALVKKGKVEDAIEYYRKALKIYPNFALAHNNIGIVLFKKGKLEEAVSHFNRAIRINPNDAKMHNNMGAALSKQGKLKEAIDYYYRSLKIKPGELNVFYNLGITLAELGKLEEAISYFFKVLQINPNDAEVYNHIGVILAKQGNLEEAIDYYSKSLKIKPNYVQVHNNIAIALTKQKRLEEAIIHYSEALQIKPNDAEVYNKMGIILDRQEKLEEAIEYYSEALQIRPNFAQVLNNIGITLAKLGELEEAIDSYSRALEIKPNYAQAHNNIGTILARQGKLEKAVAHFSMALQIKPGYVSAQNNLKIILQRQD